MTEIPADFEPRVSIYPPRPFRTIKAKSGTILCQERIAHSKKTGKPVNAWLTVKFIKSGDESEAKAWLKEQNWASVIKLLEEGKI
jgi:hypothetical protein